MSQLICSIGLILQQGFQDKLFAVVVSCSHEFDSAYDLLPAEWTLWHEVWTLHTATHVTTVQEYHLRLKQIEVNGYDIMVF